MEKPIYKSKTVYGFGIAGLIGIGQVLGIPVVENSASAIIQIVSAVFGFYGLRDSVS